ncbi:hypothetical protein BD626DRAFT_543561 [Schizophyllum amplum]|uniref:DNA 3'-5' helicase n=1 Tax=Schizophyllum amplum TaxID=97359 RepID=A0A550BRM1_9AGAR|nr:hypothetical protein BD626DRAFT_543561 [Auriculariopsis ampla]
MDHSMLSSSLSEPEPTQLTPTEPATSQHTQLTPSEPATSQPTQLQDTPHSQPTLLTTKLLKAYDLVFNTVDRVVICTSCRRVIDLPGLFPHLRREHKTNSSDIGPKDTASIRNQLIKLGASNDPEPFVPEVEPRLPIKGVASPFPVFGCSKCPFVNARDTDVSNHCKYDCPARGEMLLHPVFVQRPRNPGPYIRVIFDAPTNSPAPTSPPLPSIQNELDAFHAALADENANAPCDTRRISAFLMRMQWPQLVGDRPKPAIRNAARFPEDTEFPGLREIVTAYFDETTKSLDSVDLLGQQLLNTAHANAPLNHVPIHKHHQHDTTILDYVRHPIRLMATLMRGDTTFEIPSSDALTAAVDSLRLKIRDGDELLVSDVHAVTRALWLHEWRRDSTVQTLCDPTVAYLAMISVKADGGYMDAPALTGILARLSRAIQLTVVHELHDCTQNSTSGDQMAALEPLLMFVQEDHLTTFATLRSFQHYASQISYSTLSLPRIWWLDLVNHRSLLYLGRRVSIDDFHTIIVDVQKKAVEAFEWLTGGADTTIDYSLFPDNLRNTSNGYSVIDSSSPIVQKARHDFTAALLANQELKLVDPTTGELSMHHARRWMLVLSQLEGYLMVLTQLTSGGPARGTELTSMIYRNTPERQRNFYFFGPRVGFVREYNKTSNILQHDQVIPNAYDAFTGDMITRTYCFLRPNSCFFAVKLWPERSPQIAHDYNTLMFMDCGKQFTSGRLSQLLGAESVRVIGWEMTIIPVRHIFAATNRYLAPSPECEENAGRESDDLNSAQSGHTPVVHNRIYGVSYTALNGADERVCLRFFKNSDRMANVYGAYAGGEGKPYTEVMAATYDSAPVPSPKVHQPPAPPSHAPSEGLPPSMENVMSHFTTLITTSLGDVSKKLEDVTTKLDEMSAAQQSMKDEIVRLQSELRERTTLPDVDMPYVSPTAPPSPLPAKAADIGPPRVVFGKGGSMTSISTAFPSRTTKPLPLRAHETTRVTNASAVLEAPAPYFEPVQGMECIRDKPYPIGQPPDSTDVVFGLQTLMRDTSAKWKSLEQRVAVATMMELKRDMIVSVRTGGGKSMVVLVPTLYERGSVCILMVPLHALQQDWKRRMDDMDVRYEEFLGSKHKGPPQRLTGEHGIIIVSVDVARNRLWKEALGELIGSGVTITRTVIDEGHLFLTSQFRPNLNDVYELRMVECPLVILSATMPPASIPWYTSALNLERPLVIRGCTDRPELAYQVQKPWSRIADINNRIRRIIAEKVLAPEDRYMIYVNTIKDGYLLKDALGIPVYHGSNTEDSSTCTDQTYPISHADQKIIYDGWLAGDHRGLICTSALSAGNDYANVRVVVMAGTPPDAVAMLQAVGRAGRDGRRAWAILMPSVKMLPTAASEEMKELLGRAVVAKIAYRLDELNVSHPDRCVRKLLNQFNDGIGKKCWELHGAELCYLCRQYWSLLDDEDRTRLAQDAYKEPVYPPLQPLLPSKFQSQPEPSALKRKLQTAFGPVREQAHQRTVKRLGDKAATIAQYKAVLDYADKACGYCLLLEMNGDVHSIPNKVHWPKHCEYLQDLADFEYVRDKIDYKYSLCFTCHFQSMGSNRLHKKIVKQDPSCHTHARLVLPMAWAILHNDKLKKEAMDALQVKGRHNWDSAKAFMMWLADEKATKHPTSATADN